MERLLVVVVVSLDVNLTVKKFPLKLTISSHFAKAS